MALTSNSIHNNTGNSATSVPSSRTRTFRSGNTTIQLQEGQTLKGVISDVHGNEITLSMEDGSSFTGKLPEASQYSIGQKAAFQITSLDQNTIYMKTIGDAYVLDIEDTIEQALEEANLPKSQRNLEVVRSLLQNQQSISRESILSSIRLCAQFPEADVNAVITMRRLNMPMTQTAIQQFESYQNQSHALLHQMDALGDAISDMLTSVGTQVPRLAKELGARLINLALDGNPSPEEIKLAAQQEQTANPAVESNGAAAESTATESTAAGQGTGTTEVGQQAEIAEDPTQNGGKPEEALAESAKNSGPLDKMRQLLTSLTENTTGKTETGAAQNPGFIHEQTGFLLTSQEREDFSAFLREYPIPDNIKQGISDGSVTARNFLHSVLQSFPEMTEEQAGKLIASPAFHAMVKGQFTSNWTISPEHLKDETGLDELYGKMSKQWTALSKFSEQVLGKDIFTDVTNQAKSMNDNLDFMKLLNQTFQYIQLPLKMQNQNAHGELYVMTRKEALKKNPNSLTVLLHLDMDHLGTLDIHVKKENTAVSVNFIVEEKSVMKLFERNVNLLSDAINEQGYAFTSELSLKETQKDIIKEFMSADAPIGDIKRYNFDLRA